MENIQQQMLFKVLRITSYPKRVWYSVIPKGSDILSSQKAWYSVIPKGLVFCHPKGPGILSSQKGLIFCHSKGSGILSFQMGLIFCHPKWVWYSLIPKGLVFCHCKRTWYSHIPNRSHILSSKKEVIFCYQGSQWNLENLEILILSVQDQKWPGICLKTWENLDKTRNLVENLDKTWNVKIYKNSILYWDNFFHVLYFCKYRTSLVSAFWYQNCPHYNLENDLFDPDKTWR